MKKVLQTAILVAVFATLALSFLPSSASAQFFEGPLVPCGVTRPCQACDLVKLAQNIINFLITLSVFIAVGLFIYAGILYVTSGPNPSNIEKAHKIFWNVLVGFIIALAAFLIVETIMQALFKQELGPWNEIQCVALPQPSSPGAASGIQPGAQTDPTGGEPSTGFTDPTGGATSPTSEQLSHSDALSQLQSQGIIVTSTNGTSGVRADCSTNGCTSLQNIQAVTVEQVIQIQKSCPQCKISVVGGTESGAHASGAQSHASGYKIDVDDNNSALNSFLTENLTRDGSRTGSGAGARYRDSCGNEYVRENTHWDVTVTKICPI